jgi:hypothetical protein
VSMRQRLRNARDINFDRRAGEANDFAGRRDEKRGANNRDVREDLGRPSARTFRKEWRDPVSIVTSHEGIVAKYVKGASASLARNKPAEQTRSREPSTSFQPNKSAPHREPASEPWGPGYGSTRNS